MGKIQEIAEKLSNGSRTKSILEDLGKPKNSMKFSEESSPITHEMGNIELYELGQISRTVQCHSCLKHLPEELTFCSCGVCLRPDEVTKKGSKPDSKLFDSTLLPCTSASFKEKEARGDSVQTTPHRTHTGAHFSRCQSNEMEVGGLSAGEPVKPREMSAPSDGGEEAVAPRVPPVPSKPTQAEQDARPCSLSFLV